MRCLAPNLEDASLVVRIGAAELASSDIALHLNNETETVQSSNQEMTVWPRGRTGHP